MFLTDDEKRMRDGAEGDAVAAAMDLLISYGDALEAERLCDIRNVAGTMTQPSPVKARLVAEGGWDKAFAVINLDSDLDLTIPPMRVPTCQLQHGFGPDSVDIVPYPAENVALQEDAESFYGRRGVNILATCTPYQVGNLPLRGEHCAWMESSAVIYAQLGARRADQLRGDRVHRRRLAHRQDPVLGQPPGRRTGSARTWSTCRGLTVETFQDWGMLGYFAGGIAGEDHPVITGDIARPDLTELKHFGAAAATSGGVELYHIPGITPEAPTVEAAFGGAAQVPEAVIYGPAERRAMYETLNEIGSTADVDFVLLGCPHASVDQIRRAARAARRQAAVVRHRAVDHGRRASLKVVADRIRLHRGDRGEPAAGCWPTPARPCRGRRPPGTRVFATDSAKQAHYLPAILGIEAWFGTARRVRRRGRHRPLERGAELDVHRTARRPEIVCTGGRSSPASSRARPWCRTSRSPAGAASTRPAA